MTSLLTHSRAETLTLLKDQHEIHQTQKYNKGKNTTNIKSKNTKTQKKNTQIQKYKNTKIHIGRGVADCKVAGPDGSDPPPADGWTASTWTRRQVAPPVPKRQKHKDKYTQIQNKQTNTWMPAMSCTLLLPLRFLNQNFSHLDFELIFANFQIFSNVIFWIFWNILNFLINVFSGIFCISGLGFLHKTSGIFISSQFFWISEISISL